MNTKHLIAVAAALTMHLGFTSAAFAQGTATPGIDQRQANQQERINKGVANGQLTPREAQNLQRGQARIERKEAHAKADGVVTRGERRHLRNAQDHQSRKIHRKKHNHRHAG